MNYCILTAAETLRVSASTLQRCIAEGRLKADVQESPGTFKISQVELERFAAKCGITLKQMEIDQ